MQSYVKLPEGSYLYHFLEAVFGPMFLGISAISPQKMAKKMVQDLDISIDMVCRGLKSQMGNAPTLPVEWNILVIPALRAGRIMSHPCHDHHMLPDFVLMRQSVFNSNKKSRQK